MSEDYETLEINQPKNIYLKLENNTETVNKLINEIDEMKKNLSKAA